MSDADWEVKSREDVRRFWPGRPPGWETSVETAVGLKPCCECKEEVNATRESIYGDQSYGCCGTKRLVFLLVGDCGHLLDQW